MKLNLIIVSLILTSKTLLAQVPSFEPSEIHSFPNIHPDTITIIEKRSQQFNELISKDIPFDQMTDYQKKLLADEMLLLEGAFYTGPIGCSWYCATGPKEITSSTELESNIISDYKSSNVHDFDLRTAWVEGKTNYGIGEEINFRFEFGQDSPLELTEIIIYNGYSKDLKTWKANSRVKSFELFVDGSSIGNLNLHDTYFGQVFKIGSYKGDSNGKIVLTLKIMDVYKGDKYQDTAISEINFDGKGDH